MAAAAWSRHRGVTSVKIEDRESFGVHLRRPRWLALAALIMAWAIASPQHAAAQLSSPGLVDDFVGKPRVLVLTDIGNEPDDQMSFVRLLLYSNELDLEGLVATTST